MRKYIEVKLDVEGLHNFPNCEIEEVEYLKYPHRHTFIFLCRIEVSHENREIEFIEFKHRLKEYIGRKYYDAKYKCCNFIGQSCETLATELLVQFGLTECSVSEDGEFRGIVTAE